MKKKLLIQRTLQSLTKYAIFLVVIMATVFACSDKEEFVVEDSTANYAAKIDGAIMGSVIASNAEISIKATNSNETITGTTDEYGEFFITGFPQGTYTITISTSDTENVQTFEDVEINVGEVTALGTVTLK